MKKVILLLGLLTSLGLTQAQAQSTALGIRAGFGIDNVEEPYLGVDVRFSLAAAPITIIPSFDYFFVEDDGDVVSFEDDIIREDIDYNLYRLGLNAAYEFRTAGRITPYVGAGINVAIASVEDESETETGLNVLGGLKLHLRSVTPFFQLDAGLTDPEFVTLGGGLLFRL